MKRSVHRVIFKVKGDVTKIILEGRNARGSRFLMGTTEVATGKLKGSDRSSILEDGLQRLLDGPR